LPLANGSGSMGRSPSDEMPEHGGNIDMETTPKPKRGRWIAFGLVVGLAATWGGLSVAGSAPSSIQTCTRKNGTIKVTTIPCTGKNTLDTWDHRTVTTGLRNQVNGLTAQINR